MQKNISIHFMLNICLEKNIKDQKKILEKGYFGSIEFTQDIKTADSVYWVCSWRAITFTTFLTTTSIDMSIKSNGSVGITALKARKTHLTHIAKLYWYYELTWAFFSWIAVDCLSGPTRRATPWSIWTCSITGSCSTSTICWTTSPRAPGVPFGCQCKENM